MSRAVVILAIYFRGPGSCDVYRLLLTRLCVRTHGTSKTRQRGEMAADGKKNYYNYFNIQVTLSWATYLGANVYFLNFGDEG